MRNRRIKLQRQRGVENGEDDVYQNNPSNGYKYFFIVYPFTIDIEVVLGRVVQQRRLLAAYCHCPK